MRDQEVGFTLVELMIVAGLLTLVPVFLLVGTQRVYKGLSLYTNTHSETKLAMSWISKDIRAAKQVQDCPMYSLDSDAPKDSEGNSLLKNEEGHPISEEDICAILKTPTGEENYYYVLYHLDDHILKRTKIVNPENVKTRTVAKSIQSVSCTTGDTAQLTIKAREIFLGKSYTATTSSTIGVRNE